MPKQDLNKMFFENPNLYYAIVNRTVKSVVEDFTPEPEFKVDNRIDNWFDVDKAIMIDLETSDGKGGGSLDAHDPNSYIAWVQTEINGEIKVQRWSPITVSWINSLNKDGHTFVFHNGAFDLYFMRMKAGIILDRVYDTMIASQVINAGKVMVDTATRVSAQIYGKNVDNLDVFEAFFEEGDEFMDEKKKNVTKFAHNLAATVYRYAREKIKKDQGNSNWGVEKLSENQLRYAEDDVRYLRRVMLNQLAKSKQYDLHKVIRLEMELLPAVVDMRYWGMAIDKDGWLKAIAKYAEEANILQAELNSEIGMELAIRYGDDVNGLFGAVPRKFSVKSNAQLLEFFKDEHLEGKPIESVSETILKKLKHPLIPKILKFKELDKLATTYGEGYMKHIRSDGRIHAELKQTSNAQGDSISTGRFSSSNPNLQNIPVELIKNLIRAKAGYRLVTCDYSSVEARILAYASGDANYIESVNAKDIHWENAKKMFKLAPDAPRDDKLRTKAKVITFSIPYGASPMGIWQKGNTETLEEAEELVNAFFKSFPDVKNFLDKSVVDALTRGYTQDHYGRIRWYEIPKEGTAPENVIKSASKAAARQAQNHPIQSLSASVTKMAIKDLYEFLKEKGWGYMILTIHDSIFFEIKEEFVDIAIPEILRIMEEAAKKVMEILKAPADVDVGEKIVKKDKLTGTEFKVYSHKWDKKLLKAVPNDDDFDPDSTAKYAKELKVDLSDLNGALVQFVEKINTQPIEWQQKNIKFVNRIREIYAA